MINISVCVQCTCTCTCACTIQHVRVWVGTIQGTAFSSNIYCRATFLHGFCCITINMVHVHFSIPLVYPQSTVAVFCFFNVAHTETCHVTGYLILSVIIDSVQTFSRSKCERILMICKLDSSMSGLYDGGTQRLMALSTAHWGESLYSHDAETELFPRS